MRISKAAWMALAVATAPGSRAWSQTPDTLAVRPHADAPALTAARVTGSVHVDGRLDEAEWQSAPVADRFTQRQPREGAPATERTEVRALIAEHALYIGARLFDAEVSKIRSRLVRRDELNSASDSDFLAVLMDPYHDHSTGVIFRVGPSGSIDDATIAASGSQDLSWDPVWHARTSIDSNAIPWAARNSLALRQLVQPACQ